MTNEERRQALNEARKMAYQYAKQANMTNLDGTLTDERRADFRDTAKTWSLVAQAMKDGDPIHDAPDGVPSDALPNGDKMTVEDFRHGIAHGFPSSITY